MTHIPKPIKLEPLELSFVYSNSHNIFGKMFEFYNPLNCIKGGLSKNRTFDVKSTAAEFASAFLEY